MKQFGCHWKDFHEIWYLSVFGYLSRKYKFNYTLTQTTGTLHKDLRTFITLSRRILLRMSNVSEKKLQIKPKHTFCVKWLFSKGRAVYEIMWKSMVEPDRPDDNTIRCMRFSYWISDSTNTLTIFNTHHFSVAKIVRRARINVTLYIHRLSCLCTITGINSDRLKADRCNLIKSHPQHDFRG
jgi:hypothetical protein